MTDINKELLLLDDGEYYIEHNCNYPLESGNGFLHRRCAFGLTTPGGYEVIGEYSQTVAGVWSVHIAKDLDVETDSDALSLGSFANRLDAITTLWQRRKEALCKHR